jgi:hypothetical protein
MRYTTAIGFFLLVPLSSAAQTSDVPKTPRFEDFAVTEKWGGPSAKVRVDNPNIRMFRSQFRDAALQPPNFAGHYRVTIWGCGTECLEGGVVDLATGKVIELPTSLRGKGWEYWMFCFSASQPSGVEITSIAAC